jgi:hypothetical protein
LHKLKIHYPESKSWKRNSSVPHFLAINRNREDPCLNLDIYWVIDELGLGELKKGGPAGGR